MGEITGGEREVTKEPVGSESRIAVPLKDPVLAAFLAWLVPGLGHLYQGRIAKSVLYFVCIMGTFLYGLYLGGSSELGWGRVVYASWRPEDRRLPYLCQIGVGLSALPALIQASQVQRHEKPPLGTFMAPPAVGVGDYDRDGQPKRNGGFDQLGQPTLHTLHKRLNHFFELGTVYTMIAGLLNFLAIFDAWGGPVFPEEPSPKAKKGREEETAAEEKAASSEP
jgi:hypothetical protein